MHIPPQARYDLPHIGFLAPQFFLPLGKTNARDFGHTEKTRTKMANRANRMDDELKWPIEQIEWIKECQVVCTYRNSPGPTCSCSRCRQHKLKRPIEHIEWIK